MRILSTLVIICLCTNLAFTQKDTLRLWGRVKKDASLTGNTIVKTYARPFHWKKKEFIKLGVVLGGSALAMLADEPIADYFETSRSSTLDDIAKVGDFMGQPENNYPIMVGMWTIGVVVNDEWMRDTGIMLFASVTTAGLVQTLSKTVVGRARPGAGEGAFSYKPFGGAAYHSFPSGHTMLAISTSWILARQINWLPGKILFFTVPVVVGASRIYDRAHWFSDIVLGSALGIAFAEAVVNIYPKLKENYGQNKLSVLPYGNGLSLTYRF